MPLDLIATETSKFPDAPHGKVNCGDRISSTLTSAEMGWNKIQFIPFRDGVL